MTPNLLLAFRARPAERGLLQEGRLAGPMPWVIAIMMFLTALAAAAGLALGSAASAMSNDLARKLTVQIVEADPVAREMQRQRVVSELQRMALVRSVESVSQAETTELLRPWLGEAGLSGDIPVPALIDVELRGATAEALATIRSAIAEVAPGATVNRHFDWLAPLAALISSLQWLAAGLVLLMTIATGATVVLAARSALNTHKATIEVMHLLGSTDAQVASLFQRRIALDALLGGGAGLLLALAVLVLIGARVQALGSELLGSAVLGWSDWLIILILPLLGAALATLSARLTVLRALRRSL